jgi:hypothetical protein
LQRWLDDLATASRWGQRADREIQALSATAPEYPPGSLRPETDSRTRAFRNQIAARRRHAASLPQGDLLREIAKVGVARQLGESVSGAIQVTRSRR